MKRLLQVISIIGLVLTILPSILVFKGVIEIKTHFSLMIVGMLLWFSTSPFWMRSKSLDDDENE